jgi:cholesterol transport system auxiliary component
MMRLLAALPLLALAACSGLLQSHAPLEQVYYLRVKGAAADTARPANLASVRIGRPMAGPGLDSSHIMLLESNLRMSYYTASRWPAVLPEVVEELAAESLRSTGSWSDVQTSESSFPSEYLLQIRIRRFDADYPASAATRSVSAPEVHVVFDCTLGRRSGREVMATFTVEGSAAAAANKLSDVVAAFEDAANMALSSLATHAADAARDANATHDSAADHAAGQKVDSPVTSITR